MYGLSFVFSVVVSVLPLLCCEGLVADVAVRVWLFVVGAAVDTFECVVLWVSFQFWFRAAWVEDPRPVVSVCLGDVCDGEAVFEVLGHGARLAQVCRMMGCFFGCDFSCYGVGVPVAEYPAWCGGKL